MHHPHYRRPDLVRMSMQVPAWRILFIFVLFHASVYTTENTGLVHVSARQEESRSGFKAAAFEEDDYPTSRKVSSSLRSRIKDGFSWFRSAGDIVIDRLFPQKSLHVVGTEGAPSSAYPLQACEGDCRSNDANCAEGLLCSNGVAGTIPGCIGFRSIDDNIDYCYIPETNEETVSQLTIRGRNGRPSVFYPLRSCFGNCRDDNDCYVGLKCFVRSNLEPVPGCEGEGEPGVNYCYGTESTYIPGKATTIQHGLQLSQGLKARIIATTGEPVQYDNGAGQSSALFHELPDGAGIFIDPDSPDKTKPRYKYVSNSESWTDGGVGAIEFDEEGNVIGYERLLSSVRNCGGGKTFWNTWISCEERGDGQIHEVNPYPKPGQPTHRVTLLGLATSTFGWFESAAYDNRNPDIPRFYVTSDLINGPLLRFTPSGQSIEYARKTGDYSQLLHQNTPPAQDDPTFSTMLDTTESSAVFGLNQTASETPTCSPSKGPSADSVYGPSPNDATYEWLVLNVDDGTYFWTTDLEMGMQSANTHFRFCEGIDIRDGFLYMTCKGAFLLYTLDLDNRTFNVSSTHSGAFGHTPDQIARLLDGVGTVPSQEPSDLDILYFCEDADAASGIHARDRSGRYYTIVSTVDGGIYGETSGLAFGPGNYKMYFSYQKAGLIFEISREDGKPFGGQRLDIKYHGDGRFRNSFEDLFQMPSISLPFGNRKDQP